MNVHQARRLARLFDEACPPPSPYASDGEPAPTVDISIACRDNDLELRFLCPETTLVRWAPSLYIREDGRLYQYADDLPGDDEDRLVRVALTWSYDAPKYTWSLETYPLLDTPAERSAA
jgi:hypothetical protein